MKYIRLFLLSFFFISPNWAAEGRFLLTADRTQELIKSSLAENRKWVPYPDYQDRQAWSDLLKGTANTLIRKGEENLTFNWQPVKASAYLEYERSGNRNIMQNPDSRNINALSHLMSAELAEGKGRFLDAIIDGVFFQCERTSWVLSAHLPRQSSGRNLPEHSEHVIDLASAEIGSLLSWAYYFFHKEFDKINPEISKRLRYEIYRKVILPYRENDHYWWMALRDSDNVLVNNWNPWCNFNVLQCQLLLEDDPEVLSHDVFKTMRSVDRFINYVHADGACEEGPSYWGHAAGKLYDYLQVLYWATDGKISLFDHEMIKNMGEYICHSYVGNKWVVNFADASARFSSDPGLIYRYGKAIGSQNMMGLAAQLVQEGFSAFTYGRDYFRVLESLVYADELSRVSPRYNSLPAVIYPETQFYYFSNPSGLFLATKAGHNAESHNHNDVGTFSLYYKGTPVLIDAGVGTYTRQTFGKERYSIWTMRSPYHNLPLINGVEQRYGKEFKARDIRVNKAGQSVSFDISQAYPEEAGVMSWLRSYKLDRNKLIIRDTYSLSAVKQPNEIHFLSWGVVDYSEEGRIRIRIEDKSFELRYDKNRFAIDKEVIQLPDTRLSKVWGPEIYLLKLTDRQKENRGDYKFEIEVK